MWIPGADVTIGCLEVPRMEATGFGVMHVNDKDDHRLHRKAGRPRRAFRAMRKRSPMGIYVFHNQFLMECLRRDASDPTPAATSARTSSPISSNTVGRRAPLSRVRSDFEHGPCIGAMSATIDATGSANIDLTDIVPDLDIYDKSWPIWTYAEITPPAKARS